MDEYVEEVKEHLINNILSQYEYIKNVYDTIIQKDFASSTIMKIRERMLKLENKVQDTIQACHEFYHVCHVIFDESLLWLSHIQNEYFIKKSYYKIEFFYKL
jgi:hypothetical protein